jgi:hypothetical protein
MSCENIFLEFSNSYKSSIIIPQRTSSLSYYFTRSSVSSVLSYNIYSNQNTDTDLYSNQDTDTDLYSNQDTYTDLYSNQDTDTDTDLYSNQDTDLYLPSNDSFVASNLRKKVSIRHDFNISKNVSKITNNNFDIECIINMYYMC